MEVQLCYAYTRDLDAAGERLLKADLGHTSRYSESELVPFANASQQLYQRIEEALRRRVLDLFSLCGGD